MSEMDDDTPIRCPDTIRRGCAAKLRQVWVSEHFEAILGSLVGENWTTPNLAEIVSTPDGHQLGRCEGEPAFKVFLGTAKDLTANVHGVAQVAGLDGDGIGYLVGKLAEIQPQR